MYFLLLAIAGFAAACTASPCPTSKYTVIHGYRYSGVPTLGALDGARAPKAPHGPASYRMSVERSDVVAVCSSSHTGAEYKTYLPLKFNEGALRMIKPVAKNSGCRSASKGTSPKLQMSFKLLDSAEVGVVTCGASQSK